MLTQETDNFILMAAGTIALLILANPRPSLSALLLFIESILINIFLIRTQPSASTVINSGILLSFLSLIIFSLNCYLETSFKRAKFNPSKISIFAGFLSIILYIKNVDIFPIIPQDGQSLSSLSLDSLTVFSLGFALFTILIAASILLTIKNPSLED